MSRDNASLGQIGEWRIIEIIREKAMLEEIDHPGIYPGDDACVIQYGENTLALTTDTIWLDTHVPPGTDPWYIGWYLAAINLSDLAAMAARPMGILFSISAPGNMELEKLERMVEGLCSCLKENNALLLGGDTKEGPGVFSATAVGTCPGGKCTPRSGVKPGDLIAVTGTVGYRAALMQLGRSNESLHVIPRLEEAKKACEAGANAGVDTSDSLAIALHALSELSHVSIRIDADMVPADALVEQAFGPGVECMALGGDFELVLSIPPNREAEVEKALASTGTPLTFIGEAAEGEGVWSCRGKTSIPLEKLGYQHFSNGGRENAEE